MVACAKVIAFFWLFCCFSLLLKKHYQNRFSDDFEMLIFSFFGQSCRVNNLATVGSITWPHFLQKNWKMWPSYWLVLFSKISFSLQKEDDFWKEKTNKTTKNNQKGGQVIDLWWPSHWPYSMHLYIYTYIYTHHPNRKRCMRILLF